MKVIETPVLIVGGAGCGLSCAMFLAGHGISSWLIERYPTTSPAPKAHYLNPRTMEIFREEGIADKIYQVSTPAENMSRVGWYTSLGGTGELDRKTIHIMDAFGGNSLREAYESTSPTRPANYPQLRLEPLLLEHVRSLPQAKVNYHHMLQSFTQNADGVVATVLDRNDETTYEVHAKYMIGADGGRTVGPALGIEMDGVERLVDMVTCHFAVDLSHVIDDDSPMIRWFINPEQGGSWSSGVMVALGPKHYDRHSEEWLMHFGFQPDDPGQFDEASVVPRLKALLRLPDIEPRVIRMNNWKVQGVLARSFREGRVFIAGDAAHRHPPTTGLGLNTAIQDAHNLAWKLAAVLKGEAGEDLLESYEAERRPVAARNVHWAMITFENHFVIDAGIGLIQGAPMEYNREAFRKLFSDTHEGVARRQRLNEVVRTQRMEFQANDMELGFHYDSKAVVPDGTTATPPSPMGDHYQPAARPGHRLPHAWLSQGTKQVSTLDLVGRGQFVLLTGSKDDAWRGEAAELDIAAISIGPGGEYEDKDGTWAALRGTGEDGAILVRPDGHVGWRSAHAAASGVLTEALAAILQKKIRAKVNA